MCNGGCPSTVNVNVNDAANVIVAGRCMEDASGILDVGTVFIDNVVGDH